jgi:hypothetical protein
MTSTVDGSGAFEGRNSAWDGPRVRTRASWSLDEFGRLGKDWLVGVEGWEEGEGLGRSHYFVTDVVQSY